MTLSVRAGFLEDQRVAGGECFDFGEGEGVLADVLDLADVEASAHDLVDEPGFALDGLPAVGVEAALDGVAVDRDLGVLVALADAAALALFDVGGAPGAIEVMNGDAAVLNVGADAHLLGRADDHRDVPGATGGEQPRLLAIVAGLVDEPHLLAWHPAAGEEIAELVVRVPAL